MTPLCEQHFSGATPGFLASKAECAVCHPEVVATTAPCGCRHVYWDAEIAAASQSGGRVVERDEPCAVHVISRFACCARAARLGCVCYEAVSCPEHGEKHVGTHE